MPKIHVLGSGSSGNCYILECKNEKLILEAGIPIKEVLKYLKFYTIAVSGCLISHIHFDHFKYAGQFQRYGITAYMTPESSANDADIESIRRMQNEHIGGFLVTPFKVPHNETECDGFYIRHPEIGKLIFITDAEMCPYDFSKIQPNHVMVECNYSNEYLDYESANKEHVLRGHMELQTCKRFLKSVDSEHLKTIGLLHLSNDNADPDRFEKEIQDEFPNAFVWIAKKDYSLKI